MPKKKKPLKTTQETSTGKNVKSINLNTLTEKQNKDLIKKAGKGKLPGYHIVNPKDKDKFLRSNPNRKKKDNLDPKIRK